MKQVKQSEVNQILQSKFPEADIQFASKLAKKLSFQSQLNMRIACKHECEKCPHANLNTYTFNASSTSANCFIVSLMPEEIDNTVHTFGFGPASRFMYMLLDKLGIGLSDIYLTSLCKCYGEAPKKASEICLRHFEEELKLLEPKKMVVCGEDATIIVRNMLQLDQEAFEDIEGIVFPVAYNDHKIEVIFLEDPQEILSKNGSLFEAKRKQLYLGLKKLILR